jgi:hypothetical protein
MIEAEKRPRSLLRTSVIVVTCVLFAVVGFSSAVGCLVFIHLEVIGFGLPRDTAPRADIITLLVIGAALGILVSALAVFLVSRSGHRAVVIVAALTMLLLAIILFGMGVFV